LVGAGAVGATYGSRLHAPERDQHVAVVCRSNYDAVHANGFHITSPVFGTWTWRPAAVFASLEAAAQASAGAGAAAAAPPPRPWDYIIIATKATTDEAAQAALLSALAPLVSDETHLVLMQNGVGIEQPFRNAFPVVPIISVVTRISAAQTAAGVIRHHRWTSLSMGPFMGRAHAPETPPERNTHMAAVRLAAMLHAGGVPDATVHDAVELQQLRWHKLAINAAFNPLTILCGGVPSAVMAADPRMAASVHAVMDEILGFIPHRFGRRLPAAMKTPEQILRNTRRNPGAKPSMLQDWEAGRPIELEAIVGAPLREARRWGYPMPRLELIYAMLALQDARRSRAA
ncbi:hypothetical protein CXG81DRAFT_700, partial [Caulochytrium protostelioides]